MRIFLTPATLWLRHLWQEGRKQSDGREKCTNVIDEGDAGRVGEPAQKPSADAGDAKSEAEKEPGDHADPSRQKALRIDDDGRVR